MIKRLFQLLRNRECRHPCSWIWEEMAVMVCMRFHFRCAHLTDASLLCTVEYNGISIWVFLRLSNYFACDTLFLFMLRLCEVALTLYYGLYSIIDYHTRIHQTSTEGKTNRFIHWAIYVREKRARDECVIRFVVVLGVCTSNSHTQIHTHTYTDS